MGAAVAADEILSLARSRAPEDRDRLLLAVVELANGAHGAEAMAATPVQGLLNSIFMSLVVEAERDIRRRLAEKLATAPWAPPALINVLALDEIEIAAPIIAQSPVLKDHDLVRLLVETTIEHQIEVARRPGLGAPVVAAILEKDDPAVMTALAGNAEATLSSFQLEQLIERSRQVTGLRAPLARRAELTAEMAMRLYAWVGETLREALIGRFQFDPAALEADLSASVAEAHSGFAAAPHSPAEMDEARAAMEQRLIDKLKAADQLRPAYLLRALREHRLSLFEAGLAALGGFTSSDVRRAVCSNRPELLALACAAVSIDKSAFPTILTLVRQLNGGRPAGGEEGARRASSAFGPFSPDVAAAAFRQAVTAA